MKLKLMLCSSCAPVAVLFFVVECATGARAAAVADNSRPDCHDGAASGRAALFFRSRSVTGVHLKSQRKHFDRCEWKSRNSLADDRIHL